jgi:hypothetical protein
LLPVIKPSPESDKSNSFLDDFFWCTPIFACVSQVVSSCEVMQQNFYIQLLFPWFFLPPTPFKSLSKLKQSHWEIWCARILIALRCI